MHAARRHVNVAVLAVVVGALPVGCFGGDPLYARWLHNDSDLALVAKFDRPVQMSMFVAPRTSGLADSGMGGGPTPGTLSLYRADTCALMATAWSDMSGVVFTLNAGLRLTVEARSGSNDRGPVENRTFGNTTACVDAPNPAATPAP